MPATHRQAIDLVNSCSVNSDAGFRNRPLTWRKDLNISSASAHRTSHQQRQCCPCKRFPLGSEHFRIAHLINKKPARDTSWPLLTSWMAWGVDGEQGVICMCKLRNSTHTAPAETYAEAGMCNVLKLVWCPEPESNWHALRRGILSPVRLPIPPSGQRFA